MDKIRRKNAQRVIVAMSGGVDSSVAAALLKRAGFDVIGIFMKFWKEPGRGENRCCSSESEIRARKVANILKIPFYVLNFEKEFKKKIVDCFLEQYRAGVTPNPCVVCNKEIKFGLLLEKALRLKADYIATGHYARLRREILNSKSEIRNHRYKLLRAKDKNKDQSYFLWKLNQKQLRHILFPVGNYTKSQVRNLAKKFKLPVFDAPESQEICFVPKTINEFLTKHLKQKPGRIIDADGKVLGKHRGLWFHTIGQRKGIGLAGGPYWVSGKDLRKNILIVTKNEIDLDKKELIAKNVNWISGKEPKLPLRAKVKIRYRHKSAPAIISKILNTKYQIRYTKPQRAVTPGQSIVFYLGRELLGGGIIC